MFYTITDRLPRHAPRQIGAWLVAMWRAASIQLRGRVVVVTGLLVAHAGLWVDASEGGRSMSAWLEPQTVIAGASILVTVGVLIQDLSAVKKRVAQADETFARKAEVDLQFAAIQAQLKVIHDDIAKNESGKRLSEFIARFENYIANMQTQFNALEIKVVNNTIDIAKVETRMERTWPSA